MIKFLIYWYFYVIVIYYMYVVLILRLATGSGYKNSRSLAPVMTPQIGSWQSWYQSLGLELYDLGWSIIDWLYYLLTTAAKIRFRHVFDQFFLFEYSA